MHWEEALHTAVLFAGRPRRAGVLRLVCAEKSAGDGGEISAFEESKKMQHIPVEQPKTVMEKMKKKA